MFKQRFFRIVSILCILFLGCTKWGKNFYVDGRVYNPITGKGIPDVEVALLRNKTGTLGTSGGREHKFSVFTDSDGYYKIEALAGVMQQNIQIRFTEEQHEKYYQIGWKIDEEPAEGVNVLPIRKGKKQHVGFEVLSMGYLKTIIKNVNCTGPNDRLVYSCYNSDYPNIVMYDNAQENGCYDYETPGNFNGSPPGYYYAKIGTYKVSYSVTRNGTTQNFEKTFEMEEGEYDTLEILY